MLNTKDEFIQYAEKQQDWIDGSGKNDTIQIHKAKMCLSACAVPLLYVSSSFFTTSLGCLL